MTDVAEEFRTELAIKRHELAELTKAEMVWLVLGGACHII